MKRLYLLGLLLCAGGCHSRLLDHSSASGTTEAVISSTDPLTTAPDFSIPTPDGFTKKVYFGSLDASGLVTIKNDSTTTIMVFIKTSVGWFRLKDAYSDAFYYERTDAQTVAYRGQHLIGKGYCIYEFTPAP